MDKASTQKIIDRLSSAQHPVLLTHIRPDGDAFGSLLGLGHTLRARGQHPSLFVEGGMIPMYQFLPGSELVHDHPTRLPEKTDCIVSLDTSTRERLGPKTLSWPQPIDIVIDHHISNPGYGVINLIDSEIPATAGVLFHMFQQASWKITPAAATCLYTGLSTDTGSFRYRGTNAQTLHAAAAEDRAGHVVVGDDLHNPGDRKSCPVNYAHRSAAVGGCVVTELPLVVVSPALDRAI